MRKNFGKLDALPHNDATISRGQFAAIDAQIDRLVNDHCGLNSAEIKIVDESI
jgi:hypothetical protein